MVPSSGPDRPGTIAEPQPGGRVRRQASGRAAVPYRRVRDLGRFRNRDDRARAPGACRSPARRQRMPALYKKPSPPSDDKRWKIVETRMRRMGDKPAALIEALHAAQEAFGYLDDGALLYVGDTLGVPHSRVYGVATFYSYFTLKPQGEHT